MQNTLAAGTASLVIMTLTGCDVSRELNENTLAISLTVSNIHNQQILENLDQFIDEPSYVPGQVVLSGGGIQVTNSFAPSFANFIQPWKALSGQYTNTYTQNWAVAPVNDPDDVRRLRALYRLAVYGWQGDRAQEASMLHQSVSPDFMTESKAADFDAEYPKPVLSDVTTTTETNEYKGNTHTQIGTKTVSSQYLPVADCVGQNPNPGCPSTPYYSPTKDLVPHHWLFWSAGLLGSPTLPYRPPENCKLIWPHYFSTTTRHSLYTCAEVGTDARKPWYDFVVWVYGATVNSLGTSSGAAGSSSQSGGGGGAKKGKGSPPTVLQNPAGSH